MAQNRAAIRQRLREFDFRALFVEQLGWDRYRNQFEVSVGGRTFTLRGVAEKHGMAVYECRASDGLPDYETRRKVEREAAKLTHDQLVSCAVVILEA